MSEMEERFHALLNNPQLMQQIMSMAQAMGSDSQSRPAEQAEPPAASLPSFDPKLLQILSQTMGQTGADGNQKELLHALSPYLSTYRVQKLERAMQAAKLARAASAFFNAGGLQMLTGR